MDFSGLFSSPTRLPGVLVPLGGLLLALASRPYGGNVLYGELEDVWDAPQDGDDGVGGGGAGEPTELSGRTGVAD